MLPFLVLACHGVYFGYCNAGGATLTRVAGTKTLSASVEVSADAINVKLTSTDVHYGGMYVLVSH